MCSIVPDEYPFDWKNLGQLVHDGSVISFEEGGGCITTRAKAIVEYDRRHMYDLLEIAKQYTNGINEKEFFGHRPFTVKCLGIKTTGMAAEHPLKVEYEFEIALCGHWNSVIYAAVDFWKIGLTFENFVEA